MSNANIEQEVQKCLKDLMHIRSRVVPVKVGKEVVASVRQNFRSGGFYGAAWKKTIRQQVPFKGAAGSYGPLLSRSTHLMSSTDYIPGDAQVTIRNTAEYSQYHNEGAESTVTKRMRKFFWAKHYEAKGGKKGSNPEADFWRNMALKKPGSRIRLPRRKFLGPSPQVDKIVDKILTTEIDKYINTHF